MTISELITELQKVQSEKWDIKVVVQYRDKGGDYHWYDDDISPIVKNWKCVI